MNSDFVLPARGGVARRLLHISGLCQIDLDPSLVILAEQDRLAADNPLRGLRRVATQFILDCDLRCALPFLAQALDRTLVLNAVHLAGIDTVTIITGNREKMAWKRALKAFDFDSRILSVTAGFEPEQQDGRRHGALLIDWPDNDLRMATMIAMAREFPRTIIVSHPLQHPMLSRADYSNNDASWWPMGFCLFPDMPGSWFFDDNEVFHCLVANSPLWLARGYRQMAMFYNVFLPQFAETAGYQPTAAFTG